MEVTVKIPDTIAAQFNGDITRRALEGWAVAEFQREELSVGDYSTHCGFSRGKFCHISRLISAKSPAKFGKLLFSVPRTDLNGGLVFIGLNFFQNINWHK